MREILRMLVDRDHLSIAQLSQTFAISEVTARSDVAVLAGQGFVTRVRGGVRSIERENREIAFHLRLRLSVDNKRAVARAAATMVSEGDAVALDASTTAYYVALELRSKRELAVLTNGLFIATALSESPSVTVILPGGTVRPAAMSIVGDLGATMLRTTRLAKGFFGARGLGLEGGLMDLSPDEVRMKREMVASCDEVWGIVDGTKWGRTALLSFAAARDVTGIVTDRTAPSDAVAAWRAAGVEVVVADERAYDPVQPPFSDQLGSRVNRGLPDTLTVHPPETPGARASLVLGSESEVDSLSGRDDDVSFAG